MKYTADQVKEVFCAATELATSFQEEQTQAIVKDAVANLKGVIDDVANMYDLAQDAAQKLVTSLMLLGHIIAPDTISADNPDDDEDGVAGRGVFQITEVTQLNELAVILKRSLNLPVIPI